MPTVVLVAAVTTKSWNTPAISSRLRFFNDIIAALIFCTSLGSRCLSTSAASSSPSDNRKIALFSVPLSTLSAMAHPLLDYAGDNLGFLLCNLTGCLQICVIGCFLHYRFPSFFLIIILDNIFSLEFRNDKQWVQCGLDNAKYYKQHGCGNQHVLEQILHQLDRVRLFPERQFFDRFLGFVK